MFNKSRKKDLISKNQLWNDLSLAHTVLIGYLLQENLDNIKIYSTKVDKSLIMGDGVVLEIGSGMDADGKFIQARLINTGKIQ